MNSAKSTTSRRTSAMAKSYTRQLTEWVGQRGHSARRDRNYVAFMAVKNDVSEALEEGWPVRTIWAHMVEQKRIGCGYDTFRAYVKRHLRTTGGASVASKSSPISARSRTPEAQAPGQPKQAAILARPNKASHAPEPISGFTFNAAPNREDLI